MLILCLHLFVSLVIKITHYKFLYDELRTGNGNDENFTGSILTGSSILAILSLN